MTPDNLQKMIANFTAAGIIISPSQGGGGIPLSEYNLCIENITKAVYFKLFVSEFIWLLLAGILVISITFNYIVNYGCKMTSEQLVKKQEKMAAVSAAQATAAKASAYTATVFSSHD
jgi:hypothetical protein